MKRSIAQSSDLIPHESSPLPPGPWLIFAPHPDDETLGMGGTMSLARQQGIEINLVVLTNGARGGNPGGPALTAVREAEVLALATELGLHSFEFWRQPDGSLTITDELVEQVAATLVTHAPATVFIPTPLELNADHRVAAALVWQGLQRGHYAGAVYAYEISVAQVCNRLIDITNVASEKRRLIDCYPSQLSQNNYAATRAAMDITRSYTLPLGVECAESFFAYPEGASGSLLAPLAAHFRNYWANIGPDPLPLVSVIIRTKNRPHLLQEALQSVVLQTHPHIELVVVNDGGSDVADLVQRYEPVLSRVCYVNLLQSLGRAGAANAGLDAASGDYLIFLDDDDLFDPEHVAGLLQALEDSPDALAAYAGVRVEGDKREPILHSFYDQALLRARNLFPIHAVLFSAILAQDGCRFDPTLSIPIEDWDFWLQVAERTDFLRVDQISAVYRRLGNSGLNPADPQLASVRAGRQLIHGKWLGRWSPAQIAEQINLAWTFYGNLEAEYLRLDAGFHQLEDNHRQLTDAHHRLEDNHRQLQENHLRLADNHNQLQEAHLKLADSHRQLEADHHQLKDANSAIAQELMLIKTSMVYRFGRWITAPWRWFTSNWLQR